MQKQEQLLDLKSYLKPARWSQILVNQYHDFQRRAQVCQEANHSLLKKLSQARARIIELETAQQVRTMLPTGKSLTGRAHSLF